jgi:hypothetical protein
VAGEWPAAVLAAQEVATGEWPAAVLAAHEVVAGEWPATVLASQEAASEKDAGTNRNRVPVLNEVQLEGSKRIYFCLSFLCMHKKNIYKVSEAANKYRQERIILQNK